MSAGVNKMRELLPTIGIHGQGAEVEIFMARNAEHEEDPMRVSLSKPILDFAFRAYSRYDPLAALVPERLQLSMKGMTS